MKAIIPAAGLGTRMASVTGGRPKELLPLAGQPILEWVLREAEEAGVDETIVVGSARKPEIDAFTGARPGRRVRVAHQDRMLGLAHAVYCAGAFDDDALVLLGDTVFSPSSPVLRLAAALRAGSSAVAAETVDPEKTRRFGIVELSGGAWRVGRILEKPEPHETPSRLAVAGRFALTRDVLALLRRRFEDPFRTPAEGETTLTDVLADALAAGISIECVPLQPDEARLDCGSASGYEAAREAFECARS